MSLINLENSLMLACPVNCAMSSNAAADQKTTFRITERKVCVPVVTFSTQDDKKLVH